VVDGGRGGCRGGGERISGEGETWRGNGLENVYGKRVQDRGEDYSKRGT